MQNVSEAYKKAMKQPMRNRGYISARIGIVSSTAQNNIVANAEDNEFAYFANTTAAFKEEVETQFYATLEQDFTTVDGSMFFLPERNSGYDYYNDGLITDDVIKPICLSIDGDFADIKGLTINFGEFYPTSFTVESNNGKTTYSNTEQTFVTEDTFNAVTYLKITPLTMVNGQGRMRILQFTCGISNTFSNKQVKSFTYKDYVSSVCESLPSQDMTLTVDNQNLYYNPDNPDSAVAYMEQGQKMKVSFGYDIDGAGTIEWVPEITTYLKSWSATDTEAKFTMVDIFDWKLNGTYYKGLYRTGGITLYELALDVLTDAGLKEDEYEISMYLKNVTVYNPLPAVKYSEALQIISNAGRCVLSVTRQGKIQIKTSFIPDMYPTAEIELTYPSTITYPSTEELPAGSGNVENETAFSIVENITKSGNRSAYAMMSNDFSIVDGTVLFLPEDESEYLDTLGYVSDAIADENGDFLEATPKINVKLETVYSCYGFILQFRNVAPAEYHVITYYQGSMVQNITMENPSLYSEYTEELKTFDELDIVFTKGYPNARVAVDRIDFGNATDYTISRNYNLKGSPTATRADRLKAISVKKSIYRNSNENKELTSEEITLPVGETTRTVYFSNPSYGLSVSSETTTVSMSITASSNYFADIKFVNGTGSEISLQYSVSGYEYIVDEQYFRNEHNDTGEEKSWENPLVSEYAHAKDIEEWLASFYLGDVEYQLTWNGDPRVDANDLFFLELKDRDDAIIRAYQSELKYSGAWSGTMKARKVVL